MLGRYSQFTAAVANIYKAIQKIERDEMNRHGLKGPHVQCLIALCGRPEGMTATELALTCEKDKAAISRALTELTDADMIARDGGYRGGIYLTEQGLRTAMRLQERVRLAVELAGRGLSDHDRRVFYDALAQIEANLDLIAQTGLPE